MRKLILFTVHCLLFTVLAASLAIADDLSVADPMTIGVGARPLGMGRAYVALAEDGDGMFMNAAGLGGIRHPKLTSMYSSLMGDVDYILIGGAYPHTPTSAFGVGAILSNTSGIDLRSLTGTNEGSATWGSNVIFVGYGVDLADSKVKFGGNLKYYSQGAGGSGATAITDSKATGIGFDLGAIYSPSEQVALGVSARNPFGVKLENGHGVGQNIQPTVKLGAKVTARPRQQQKLNIAADVDLTSNRPAAFHFGAEYFPVKNIALRGGMDQDPAGTDNIEVNLTAGVGLRVSELEFNYAFHPYTLSDNTTHYFSISYVGPEEEKDSVDLALTSPADKSVIYADNVEVAGKVAGAYQVKVNGLYVPVDPASNSFKTTIPVDKVGKKLILVEATDNYGKTFTDSRRVVRLVSFSDVPEGYWAKQPIENTGTVGLVEGYPDGAFRPNRNLTRAELATLLVRAKDLEPMEKPIQVFKDVKSSHWAAGYVELAKRQGLVRGYPDGSFRPNNQISKAEAIAVLVRYDKRALFDPVEAKPFSDIKVNHWAAGYVQLAKQAGMLNYITDHRLRPSEAVSRAETMEMMSHTSIAGKLIDELFSWNKGFEQELSKPLIKAGL